MTEIRCDGQKFLLLPQGSVAVFTTEMICEPKYAAAETIVFNVGGTLVEVSRFLIEEWPKTMLARLALVTSHGDSREPIFIDRNGLTFQVVLDYLRQGSVVLPHNLPRLSFIRELDFYGIPHCGADIRAGVNVDSSVNELKRLKEIVATAELNMNLYSSVDELRRLNEIVATAELHHDMFLIAHHAYHQYMSGRKSIYIGNEDYIGLKRFPTDYFKDSLMASMALSRNLKSYYGLQAYISFSNTSGMRLKRTRSM